MADQAVTFATSASVEVATAAGAAAGSGMSPAWVIALYEVTCERKSSALQATKKFFFNCSAKCVPTNRTYAACCRVLWRKFVLRHADHPQVACITEIGTSECTVELPGLAAQHVDLYISNLGTLWSKCYVCLCAGSM